MEEQNRRAWIAARQLHQGTQPCRIGVEPFRDALLRGALLIPILHGIAQFKQQVPYLGEREGSKLVNFEELEECAVRSVNSVARLGRGSEKGQVAPRGQQLAKAPLLPVFDRLKKPVCVVHQQKKAFLKLLADLRQKAGHLLLDFLRSALAKHVGKRLDVRQHRFVLSVFQHVGQRVHGVEQKVVQAVHVVLLFREGQHNIAAA
ncbi:MAG: hypothetical protein ABSH49_13615 [Bryobacteraceae bacterium]